MSAQLSGAEPITLGVIGGSGLYSMDDLEILEERHIETPFGAPSDALVIGDLHGARIAFLARHGRGHQILPGEIPFRANIFAMKLLGIEAVLSVSAVGSLQLRYAPTHMVVPDQFYDRTRHRPDTFFGDGLVAHVSMADPVCPVLAGQIGAAAETAGAVTHRGGTYLCMEGPQFSTRAESEVYRGWGMDVIGMTNLQEAKLAREAEICYATLAMVTDYDCWHETEEAVEVSAILAVLRQNAAIGQQVVRVVSEARSSAPQSACRCREALATAIVTDPARVPEATRERLRPIVGKYLPPPSATPSSSPTAC